jgi:type IV secretion system protein VirB5
MRLISLLCLTLCTSLFFCGRAHAQFAVIDAASVAQLVQQTENLAQQLATTRAQLLQLQTQYQSMTGGRGMQSLLAGTTRNYLPTQWTQISTMLAGGTGGYGSLAQIYQGNLRGNAVLTTSQLAALPPGASAQVVADRQSVALLQSLSQDALANASARFAAIQQLIDALGTATDQKGVLDLQARISAEQGMLQNEQTKLQVLFAGALGQEWANRQIDREQAITGQGQFATRFEPTPR